MSLMSLENYLVSSGRVVIPFLVKEVKLPLIIGADSLSFSFSFQLSFDLYSAFNNGHCRKAALQKSRNKLNISPLETSKGIRLNGNSFLSYNCML